MLIFNYEGNWGISQQKVGEGLKEQPGFTKNPLKDKLNGKYSRNGESRVYFVGKLDKSIYKCIADKIVTDDVVITDERINHIKDRHPGDFRQFMQYISEIIEKPDYIVEANKRNTAVILKEIENNGKKFKTILRIKVEDGFPEYKNSIISFWSIGEVTWKKTLKNKKILYIRKEK